MPVSEIYLESYHKVIVNISKGMKRNERTNAVFPSLLGEETELEDEMIIDEEVANLDAAIRLSMLAVPKTQPPSPALSNDSDDDGFEGDWNSPNKERNETEIPIDHGGSSSSTSHNDLPPLVALPARETHVATEPAKAEEAAPIPDDTEQSHLSNEAKKEDNTDKFLQARTTPCGLNGEDVTEELVGDTLQHFMSTRAIIDTPLQINESEVTQVRDSLVPVQNMVHLKTLHNTGSDGAVVDTLGDTFYETMAKDFVKQLRYMITRQGSQSSSAFGRTSSSDNLKAQADGMTKAKSRVRHHATQGAAKPKEEQRKNERALLQGSLSSR